MDQQLLDKRLVARRLRVSIGTVNNLMRRGELAPVRIGRSIRFMPETVQAFVRKAHLGSRRFGN